MSAHGTRSCYVMGCRCDDCRESNTEYQRELYTRLRAKPTPEHLHGTSNAYANYGCRCEACWSATRKSRAEKAKRKVA